MVLSITLAILFGILAILFVAIWIYKDAKQRGLNAELWTLVFIFIGNFVGLILYLLIGRKEPITNENYNQHDNKKLVFLSISSLIISFAFIIASIFAIFFDDGFMFEYKIGGYGRSSNGKVNNITEKSGGDTWELSFEDATAGYVFSRTYNAKSNPKTATIDLTCSGNVQLIISQDDIIINEVITNGVTVYNLSDFDNEKIHFKIITIDSPDVEVEIIVT